MISNALRLRFSEIYGVDAAEILPVRGVLHGQELVIRSIKLSGGSEIAGARSPELERLAAIYGLNFSEQPTRESAAVFCPFDGVISGPETALTIIDESEIEYSDKRSQIYAAVNIIVIRSLAYAYGLKEEPCAALIAKPALIDRLSAVLEPAAIPPIIERAALNTLDPSRLPAAKMRIANLRRDRARLAEGVARSKEVASARELDRAAVLVEPVDAVSFLAKARAWKIKAEPASGGTVKLRLVPGEKIERILLAFDAVEKMQEPRAGEIVRETAETKIAAIVDLDRSGQIEISTGVGFLDHMMTQIAHHAGISVALSCKGDLKVDAHHTIEDCAIAFGQALSQALGARRGIARFGFLLPMDEAEAQISIDLGGRPYLVFDGSFTAPLIGDYPTEMTEHVFRSLAQSLGAAIHLSVKGDNDHHKTEACYKAFGRALRQAVRIESDVTPSTKGVL